VVDTAAAVRLRSGLALLPAAADAAQAGLRRLTLSDDVRPALQLDRTLCEIGQRYGAATRDWVAFEMEHPVGAEAADEGLRSETDMSGAP